MASEFQLRVVTPRAAVIDEPVREVTAPGTVGEFGVLPDHANFLSSLEPGRLAFKDASGTQVYAIREGFAEVSNNVMNVLTEAAVPAAEIDAAKARADLQAAETALAALNPSDTAWEATDLERRWAQARLDVAAR
jgi:F-type H+-transporting ATPase subunit epsilon